MACEFVNGQVMPYVEEYCQDILSGYRAFGLDPMVEPKTAMSIGGGYPPFFNYFCRMTDLLALTSIRIYLANPDTCNPYHQPLDEFMVQYRKEEAYFVKELQKDMDAIRPYMEKGFDLEEWERTWPYVEFPIPEKDVEILKKELVDDIKTHLDNFDRISTERPTTLDVYFKLIDRANHILAKHYIAKKEATAG